MRTRLSLANALVLIDLELHRLSRIAVHDACAFGLRCATQGVLPFAFDRHVQSSQVQAAMPIFCSSVRREAAQTCGPSEPPAWGWGKGVCPLGTRETLCLPSGSEFSFHRAAILLSCGVGTQLALRPLQLEAGSRRGTSARKAYPPSFFRGLASRRWRQLRYTEGLASLATEPFERVAKPREQSDESATGSFQ